MRYRFGVMSNLWTLTAKDKNVAYLAMIMFIGQNVPIAVYEPKEDIVNQMECLLRVARLTRENPEFKDDIKVCMKTIKKI